MSLGAPQCRTILTSGLLMPMPKATVATTTFTSSLRKALWEFLRAAWLMPAWYMATFQALVMILTTKMMMVMMVSRLYMATFKPCSCSSSATISTSLFLKQ